MVLNVADALLRRDPKNADRLSGNALSKNLQSARRYPPGSKAGALTMRGVPGHDAWVIYPYDRDYPASASRCRGMGQQCGVNIEVRGVDEVNWRQAFYQLLHQRTGGLPGQTDDWRGKNQWTKPLNTHGDRVGLAVLDDALYLWIRNPPVRPHLPDLLRGCCATRGGSVQKGEISGSRVSRTPRVSRAERYG